VKQIHPKVPTAELHVFAGWKTYGAWGLSVKKRMQTEIDYAALFASSNIIIREVIPKAVLFEEMRHGRAIFYRGDKAETFCLAVAEAQALGLPAVVCDLGSMKERVDNGVTGFVVNNEVDFVSAAIRILNDDVIFETMSLSSSQKYAAMNWSAAANQFLNI
jgi:glycosyltransferase involved in cell wall biosynthesis